MEVSQDEVHNKFLNYDWDSFTEFQDGLKEILDNYLSSLKERDPLATSIPPAEKQQLIDQAKLFFFCSHTGHILNLDDFYAWKRNNGGKITEIKDDETPADSENPEETPYSSNYQHVVEMIVSGKPVPGIKEIPDTVLPEQSSVPKATQRRKPWEKDELKMDLGEMM